MRLYNITEFPFFSFWLGDMHPHVMALPFGLLALALALATLARPDPYLAAPGVRGWLDVLLTGLILGSLYVINSWDLPTYLLLYLGALFLLQVRHNDDPDAFPWKRLGWQGGLVVLVSFALFTPFYLTFHSLVGSGEPLTSVPILSKFTQMVAPVSTSRTGIHAFLIIFGLFAAPLIAFAYLAKPLLPQPHPQPEPDEQRPSLLPWLFPAALVVGVVVGFPLLSMAALALFAFYRAMYRATRPAESFVLLVVALGGAILFGTDLMYIRDVFNTRMNTIFKFYYQVWLLWGTLAGYALWWLIAQPSPTPATTSNPPSPAPAPQEGEEEERMGEEKTDRCSAPVRPAPRLNPEHLVRWSVGVLFVGFLAGALVFPALTLGRMAEQGTLVGLSGRTPREHTSAGQASIAWLREHASPDQVLLEMVPPGGGSYSPEGHAGVSASTGIPTVIGWVGHERQWRGGDEAAKQELDPRQKDVDTIYATLDPQEALDLLAKYGVTYIYVGGLERRAYSAESLAKFDTIAEPVFQQGEVVIYRVRLPPETGTGG
ncbi:MAG: hypothetical protein HC884_05400 [Chloroflexaceae bacterium]|nr:hypothetical protein [Chloroflexaceae bacterium]